MSNKAPLADSIKFTDEFIISESDVKFTRTAIKANTVIFTKEYILELISPDALFEKRYSGEPGLVLKHGTNLYYTSIPKSMKFFANSNLGSHLCSDCGRLSALPDTQGGCRKVRDKSITFADIRNSYNKKQALTGAKRIEKYTFVELGYESFNTTQDAFLVLSCCNRANIVPHPKPSSAQAKVLKESLAAFMENDFLP